MPGRGPSIVGLVAGRLTVVAEAEPGPPPRYRRHYTCRCSCGNVVRRSAVELKNGKSKSCGCLLLEGRRQRAFIHGESLHGDTREYRAWNNIKERCYNPNNPAYADYGARGITMDEEWRTSYTVFLAAVGRCPSPELTLDRIDNDRGYVPGNVRWATRLVQNNNKRPYWLPYKDEIGPCWIAVFPPSSTGSLTEGV